MKEPRREPLFLEGNPPTSWNERMHAGEFAVHSSGLKLSHDEAPYCIVFETLQDARTYARNTVALEPFIRCRIYTHDGFVGAPIDEARGALFKEEGELSHRVRRWLGSFFLVSGFILIAIDWQHDLSLSWPAMIGTRLLIPGFILWISEAVVLVRAKHHKPSLSLE